MARIQTHILMTLQSEVWWTKLLAHATPHVIFPQRHSFSQNEAFLSEIYNMSKVRNFFNEYAPLALYQDVH